MRALFRCGTPKEAADARKGALIVIETDDACAVVAAAVIDGQPALVVALVTTESDI